MEINNVNGINSVNPGLQPKEKKSEQQDIASQGDKITMDTSDPAEMLGRSMIQLKKENVDEPTAEFPNETIGEMISKKIIIARSYMGKTRLFLKKAGPELLLKLGVLLQKKQDEETPEQAEIRYILKHQYPDSIEASKIVKITTPVNKDLIKRLIVENIILPNEILRCFNSYRDNENIIKLKEEVYDFAKEHMDFKNKIYIGNPKSEIFSSLIGRTTEATAPFLKRLILDDKFPNIHCTVSLDDTKEDVQAKERMYDFILKDESLNAGSYSHILEATTKQTEELLKKLYKDSSITNKVDIVHSVNRNDMSTEDMQAKMDLYEFLKAESFTGRDLIDILSVTNKYSKSFIEKLFRDGVIDKKYIETTAIGIRSEEIASARNEIYELIKKDKDIDPKTFARILLETNKSTKSLIEKYYSDNIIPRDRIWESVSDRDHCKTHLAKFKIYKLIAEDKNYSGKAKANILKSTYDYTVSTVEKLYKRGMIPSSGYIESFFDGFYSSSFKEDLLELKLENPNCEVNDLYETMKDAEMLTNNDCYFSYDGPYERVVLVKNLDSATCGELIKNMDRKDVLNYVDDLCKINQQVLNDPKKYVNGSHSDEENKKNIDSFFYEYATKLFLLEVLTDKETVDVLLRRRLKKAKEFFNSLGGVLRGDIMLVRKLAHSKNIDGKPFSPAQKLEFVDLINGYQNNNMSMEKIEKMIESGVVNLLELQTDLFNQIMKNSGLTDKEIAKIPKEKRELWDIRYAPLLAKGIKEAHRNADNGKEDVSAYTDIIRAANLDDFETYIDKQSNCYGKANAVTKQMFKKMDFDYEKWIHPSKELETDFVSVDKNQEHLKQIADQIIEDMNILMKTPVKGHIKKQFPDFVKQDEFIIPNEIMVSKAKLLGLVKKLNYEGENGNMTGVWNRAKSNLQNDNPDKVKSAQRTLMVLDHLKQRQKDIEVVKIDKEETSINWKIKMWDRIPQKDLFQGNYSTCCIAVGNFNGHAMPHYLMNRAFNMIELVDNDGGQTVGNALCYFVKDEYGRPAFVIDNIEINNAHKLSKDTGISLRQSILDYASKVVKDITGNDDIPIYIGGNYNDVHVDDLKSCDKKISFLGDFDSEYIYMDAFGEGGEWTSRNKITNRTRNCKLLKLQ